ncbi:hypothetical protein [Phytoactinopolyspora endophytica]|nr:hypothetical protein [Phytoactinopolyspora endophytica]
MATLPPYSVMGWYACELLPGRLRAADGVDGGDGVEERAGVK